MSVAPNRAEYLPQHRRPPAYGGTGRDPVFVLESQGMDDRLRYRADPRDVRHGFIEPSGPTTVAELRSVLCMTRSNWDTV
jgi:hypothetical protein